VVTLVVRRPVATKIRIESMSNISETFARLATLIHCTEHPCQGVSVRLGVISRVSFARRANGIHDP
jgi:hypothetical protein